MWSSLITFYYEIVFLATPQLRYIPLGQILVESIVPGAQKMSPLQFASFIVSLEVLRSGARMPKSALLVAPRQDRTLYFFVPHSSRCANLLHWAHTINRSLFGYSKSLISNFNQWLLSHCYFKIIFSCIKIFKNMIFYNKNKTLFLIRTFSLKRKP